MASRIRLRAATQATGNRTGALALSQASTSASNFLLFGTWGLVAGAMSLGQLATAFAVIGVTLGLTRAWHLDVRMLVTDQTLSRLDCVRIALGCSAPGIVALAGLAAATGEQEFMISAAALPFVILQDVSRYFYFLIEDAWAAARCDGIFLVAQICVTVVALVTGHDVGVLLAYPAGAVAGCLYWAARSRGRGTGTGPLTESDSKLRWGLAIEYLAGKGIGDLMIPVVGIAGTNELTGALKLGQLALGPTNVLENALRIGAMSDWRTGRLDAWRSAQRFFLRLSTAVALACAGIILGYLVTRGHIALVGDVPFVVLVGLVLERLLSLTVSRDALVMRLCGRTMSVGSTRLVTGLAILASVGLSTALWQNVGLAAALVGAGVFSNVVWRHTRRTVVRSNEA